MAIDFNKRPKGMSKREYASSLTGQPKENFDENGNPKSGGSSGSSSSSGSQPLNDKPGHNISADAYKAIMKLPEEARNYIIKQDFGGELTSGEVKKLNSKWIDASKANSVTKENLAVYGLPQDAFNITIPQLKPGTPEYQTAMDKLSTAYFDVIQQQLNASTEQEKSVADYNWNTLKSGIEKSLGVSLSNDAYQAWTQLQGIKNQYAQGNIANSGIQNETMDTYLANIRRLDATNRQTATDNTNAGELNYYTKFATSDQIKALVDSDPEKARSFGLIPSDEIRSAFSFENMKSRYPNMSDDEINRSISSVLDTNGNYRSALYQKYMTGGNLGINQGTVGEAMKDQYGNPISISVKPSDSGYLDVEAAKRLYQTTNTPLANQLEDYNRRVSLGSIQPTAGTDSGTSYGTQFNKVTPPKSVTPMLPGAL